MEGYNIILLKLSFIGRIKQKLDLRAQETSSSDLKQTRISKHVWDYATTYISKVRSHMAHPMFELHG